MQSYEKEYKYYTEILVKVRKEMKEVKVTTSTVVVGKKEEEAEAEEEKSDEED